VPEPFNRQLAFPGELNSSMYQVTLPTFEGPLDLLLHLIERQKLDLTHIALAQVTDQFLAHMESLDKVSPSYVADFLVVAARLVLIKSRWLLPQPSTKDAEEESCDAEEDLLNQLREFQRFKAAARSLADRETLGLRAYARQNSFPVLPARIDLGSLSLDDLLAAVHRAMEEKPIPPPKVIVLRTVTIVEQADVIRRWLRALPGQLSFSQLLSSTQSRLEIVITFLALLELIKRREVAVLQDRLFGDILVELQVQTPN
jgi:segregation and condensation protein A